MSALGSGVCAVPNFSLEDILQILLFLVLAQLHWVAWELGGFQTILCFKKACRGVVLFSASGFPGIQLAFCRPPNGHFLDFVFLLDQVTYFTGFKS